MYVMIHVPLTFAELGLELLPWRSLVLDLDEIAVLLAGRERGVV